MFRFTIRDVLWLTLVVAMGAGWFCDRRWQRAERRAVLRSQGEIINSLKAEASRARAGEAKAVELFNDTFSRRATKSPDDIGLP